jgi:CHRD domain
LKFSGLTGPVTGAHFHGPAAAGVNAGVVIPLTGAITSPISGEVKLTPAQAADLLAEKLYFNLHTAAHPNGEIRGQVMAKKGSKETTKPGSTEATKP